MNNAAASPPLVSVIVPAFNAALTLRETISSALASTYRDIEIIIVDDGSTDATAAIAQEFVRSDNRVRLECTAGGGVSKAFNVGLALARGTYVARLDADDLWHATKIGKQVSFALSTPDAPFIYTFVRYIDGQGRVLRDAAPQRFPGHALCRGLYESLVGGNSSALMRRSTIAEIGGYEESLASWEDLLLQLRISERHQLAHVPEYLVGYRVRPGSLSSDPQNMLVSWRRARRRIIQLFPQIPPRVHAWAHAKRYGELGEALAWRGRPARAASLLLQALWLDPAWTIRFLQYRWMRRWNRARSAKAAPEPGPLFPACRPEEQIRPDEYLFCPEARKLRRLDQRRVAWLGALDASLVPRDEAG